MLSGWYYDLQLGNKLMSATLHPNQELNSDKSKWVDIAGEKDPDNPKYAKDPLCTAIVNEDFNVSVANSWSDFGGDMLGQMWESIKPLAPYVDEAKIMIDKAATEYENLLKSSNPNDIDRANRIKESTMSRKLGELMIMARDKMNNGSIDVADYLNRALVVQGTRFSYYSGSGTSFGNLMMKFTIFPTYDEKGKFKSVDEQVEKLFPYCIGKFVSGTDGLLTNKEREEGKGSGIDNMISWQKPPGGFRANVKNVDVVQTGTLLLKFGAYYMIDNLVVENASFNFSKQMTKNPKAYKQIGNSDIISPLYCDVSIQLRPATKYSDESLKKFVLGRGSTKTQEVINSELKKNVSNITDL